MLAFFTQAASHKQVMPETALFCGYLQTPQRGQRTVIQALAFSAFADAHRDVRLHTT
jgi:hypothetical protein